MKKLLFITFLFSINYSLCSGYFCKKNEEVHFKNWCYKLFNLETYLNVSDCFEKSSLNCLKKSIDTLLKIYTSNPRIDNEYEFTVLKSPFKDEASLNIWLQLIDLYHFSYRNKNHVNIFFNSFTLKNHAYLEQQPFDIENPNLLIHSDDEDEITSEKCLYVHQTLNFNEKFNFKYGNCNKKLPFICIKPPIKNSSIQDRCSLYSKTSPGGQWIECDKLFNILENENKYQMSKSQKCCMYNINWRENFESANRICSYFDSDVFYFKAKGYTSMLGNYDSYLDLNYVNLNQSEFMNFWTSCKILDYTDSNEPICSQDSQTEKIENYDFEYPLSDGFVIYSLNYTFKNQIGFKLINYNLTQIYNALNNKDQEFCNKTQNNLMECLQDFFKSLTLNSFLITRRKQNYLSSLITRVVRTENISFSDLECFNFQDNKSDSVYLSLPFLNKCYNFILVKKLNFSLLKNISLNSMESINSEILHGLLKSLGILEISCYKEELANSSKIFLIKNVKNIEKFTNCSQINEISLLAINLLDKFNQPTLDWFRNFSFYYNLSNFMLILQGHQRLNKILELNCFDSALKLYSQIDKCKKFNEEKFCLIKCPLDCNFDLTDNQYSVWQVASFKYLILSSICKAAFHSNIFNKNKLQGALYLSPINSSHDIYLLNNRIETSLWPPIGLMNKVRNPPGSNLAFYFENPVINSEDLAANLNRFSFVLVKAINFVQKSKLNTINIKLYSYDESGLFDLRLKRWVPLGEEFSSINFSKETIKINKTFETNINFTYSYKKLSLINDFFEMCPNFNIKFPINILNLDYSYFVLEHRQTIALDENTITSLQIQLIRNTTQNKKFNCHWYIHNLNTEIPCKTGLNFNLNSSQITLLKDIYNENLIIYPKIEVKDLNFFRQFTRVVFSQTKNKNCQNGALVKSKEIEFCVCLPGFTGLNCEKTCDRAYFGQYCEITCPDSDCTGYLICHQDPIGCSCAPGLTGYYCNEACPKQTWGPGCMFKCDYCPNRECNRFTGECVCDSKSFGKYCEQCVDGFYGENCSLYCQDLCSKCDKINGTCLDIIKEKEEIITSTQTVIKSNCIVEKYKNNLGNIFIEEYKSNITDREFWCFTKQNLSICKQDNLVKNKKLSFQKFEDLFYETKSNLFCKFLKSNIKSFKVQDFTYLDFNQIKDIYLKFDFEKLMTLNQSFVIEKIYYFLLKSSNKTDPIEQLLGLNFSRFIVLCSFDQKDLFFFGYNFTDKCNSTIFGNQYLSSLFEDGKYNLYSIFEFRSLELNSSILISVDDFLSLNFKSTKIINNENDSNALKNNSNQTFKNEIDKFKDEDPKILISLIIFTLLSIVFLKFSFKFFFKSKKLKINDTFLFNLEFCPNLPSCSF